jgi:predicted NAD/FAD-dependent oxidoreductase
MDTIDVLIVGAGICGLTAAGSLRGAGASVLVFDKGSSVGGRLATRRIGQGRADHGAQFFTARDPQFIQSVVHWREQDLVYQWSKGWSDGSLDRRTLHDGHPRYAVRGGMNALAKHLAGELQAAGGVIETGVQVTRAEREAQVWVVEAADGRSWRGRSLVLTAPVPQSLALLDALAAGLTVDQRQKLEAIAYAPCLCALCTIDGPLDLPEPGALQQQNADIAWIADNRRKGISSEACIVTLHGNPTWSAAHYDESDEILAPLFYQALSPWLGDDAHISAVEIKRWRYALPTAIYPKPFLRAEAPTPPLYFGGDAFGAPRVEGAYLSGLAIGEALLVETPGVNNKPAPK